MTGNRLQAWLHRWAERSGLAGRVARFHHRSASGDGLDPWSGWLFRIRHWSGYPAVVGLLALVSAGAGLYPFGPVIVAATVFAPARWRSVYLGACLGAALGATCCAILVQSVGVDLVDSAFPDIRQHAFWEKSAYWIGRHGWIALTAIAALPVPQMPALIVASLAELHPLAIGAALFLGKLVKYGVYVLAVRLVLKVAHRVVDDGPPG